MFSRTIKADFIFRDGTVDNSLHGEWMKNKIIVALEGTAAKYLNTKLTTSSVNHVAFKLWSYA
jgi:hypothetical protein